MKSPIVKLRDEYPSGSVSEESSSSFGLREVGGGYAAMDRELTIFDVADSGG